MKNEAPIGPDRLRRARQDLNRYREGKANLERRVIENEQWYRLRHWECIRRGAGSQVEPTSGWLFNAIANKHAEAMDNYPSPNVLPREEGDREKAQALGSILPVILQQEDFEDTYDRVMDDKLKSGTGIYGVFWDPEKLEGLGDISIRRIDILNLYWEGGITDIQQSRNVFYLRLWDNDLLLERYPQLEGKLSGAAEQGNRYVYDDRVDTADKSAVIDWYYKKRQGGKTVLHYCKFVGDTVLFATENEEDYRDRGWYDHGLYPFVLDPMFRTAGSPCGFGYIDVAKSAQEYVDRGNQAILQNLLANARPRHFIRADGAVNEEEYGDMTRDFVHVDGNLGEDSIKPISGKSLSDIYVTVIANKIDELKEVTGTRDVTTGGTVHGVTAASAIAAMQEAGSKLSRDSNMASYRAFRKVCLMAVELIRQFYDLPRAFRILGPQGGVEFITFSNAGLKPQDQGVELGVELGMRTPLFDIEISAEKQSPYSRLSQNEMAMQFYSAGLFDPARSTEALTALDMMDFNGKSALVEKVRQNGGRYQAERTRPQVEPMAEGKMRLRSGDNASPV
nr:MAG TPA: portal protein [Caudoviricetes sp.]